VRSIPLDEIRFHSTSFCDSTGRVFWWKEKLYRGIYSERADFQRELFEKGLIDRMVAEGFIPLTERTDFSLDGFSMVLHHQRLPFVTYPFEWCFEQMSVVAFFLIKFVRFLAANQLTLDWQDTNPWNVLFEGSQPRYIDVGSIVPLCGKTSTHWNEIECFKRYVYYPLVLLAQGRPRVARALLNDYEFGLHQDDFSDLTGIKEGSTLATFVERARRFIRRRTGSGNNPVNQLDFAQALIRSVEAPPPPSPPATDAGFWGTMLESLLRASPGSVLALGDDGLAAAICAAEKGVPALFVHRNEMLVRQAYIRSKEHRTPLVCAVGDLRYPQPGMGALNREIAPAFERYGASIVVAAGTVKELHFERTMTLDQIAETLRRVTSQTLVVSAPHRSHPEVEKALREQFFSSYSPEAVGAALARHFSKVDRTDSTADTAWFMCSVDD